MSFIFLSESTVLSFGYNAAVPPSPYLDIKIQLYFVEVPISASLKHFAKILVWCQTKGLQHATQALCYRVL